ncbi:hypothetical protein [Candidatus Mycoplasma haematominutum]|uniref:Uncharacterized protein n=1 Tax=Candidatus Mycoplasma haematominutum 'Birmingham 1' TaxID=1116213 RepID=G8C3D5_9MOLU|nr:hypothetical protein [Candidatus Mycoplasma haematominutum]CCE66833.1 hypothetical protein MHM_03150 [Candidatus Mycoplasma haematominutum 'Birmingham 1']
MLAIFSAGSGATSYSLASGAHIVPQLSFSGRRIVSALDTFSSSNNLILEAPSSKGLNGSPFKSSENNTLTINSNNLVELSTQESLNQTLNPLISNTFSELQRENRAIELEKESAEAIKIAREKINKEDSQLLIGVVQKYRDYNSEAKPRRRRREIDSTFPTLKETPSLSDQERQVLSKHYGQFVNLSELKHNFEGVLTGADGGNNSSEIGEIRERIRLREGIDSLRIMRWDYPTLQLFGGKYGAQRRDTLDPQRVRAWKNIECKDEHCGWTRWEDNPYRNFFESEETWKSAILAITTPQQKLVDNIDNPRKVVCSMLFFPGMETFVSYYSFLWLIRKAYISRNGAEFKKLSEESCGSNEQNLRFKEIVEAKNSLQFKIGSELLERMKLLNIKS